MCCGVTSALTYFLLRYAGIAGLSQTFINLWAYHFPTRFHARSDMLKKHFTSLKYQVFRSEAFKTAQVLASNNATLKALNIDTNCIRFGPIDTVALDASYLWGNAYEAYAWVYFRRKQAPCHPCEALLVFTSQTTPGALQ